MGEPVTIYRAADNEPVSVVGAHNVAEMIASGEFTLHPTAAQAESPALSPRPVIIEPEPEPEKEPEPARPPLRKAVRRKAQL